ncbi:MAG TPA: alpha/beta hydrolase-fold protein [Acidobacteriaceae bacterium]|jgi:esterase/lipase superfamily enzyme|nr:alpha/beta hydrolase-fold protein [Acidobacteriaceae bacterium]
MNREYHTWYSSQLSRDMELLVFGHSGAPLLVFPTSCGRFFEFEDRGMVAALSGKIDNGELQLYCVDSVDGESWYNRNAHPRDKIVRHMQYENYLLEEMLPLVRQKNQNPYLAAVGCSFGGYHAANIALRRPDIFTGFLSMSGAFDVSNFLRGYYDNDCYFNIPMHYMANLQAPWYLEHYRRNTFVLATGVHDQCWNDNEMLAAVLRAKGIPHRLDVWGDNTGHDWPYWQRMVAEYL